MRNQRHADDASPLEPGCACPACRDYSRAYLHHLIKAGEILGAMLLTWHNLHYYQRLMAEARAAIEAGRFAAQVARAAADLAGYESEGGSSAAVRPA
jgi:queuine tRNA-ribosyltransferase